MLLRITVSGCSFDVYDPQRAGYQDKEHVDQTLQGILRILNLLNHSTHLLLLENVLKMYCSSLPKSCWSLQGKREGNKLGA